MVPTAGIENDVDELPRPVSSTRTWLVTALALLLLVQAAGLFGVGAYNLIVPVEGVGVSAVEVAYDLIGVVFILLALMACMAAVAFLRLARGAWLFAMMLQGLCLLVALILYFREKPGYAYFGMLYGIIMVLYLNYYEVLIAFRPAPMLEDEENG